MSESHREPKIELRKMPADQLKVHPLAQRRIVMANLRKIINTLDLDAIGVLHVVRYRVEGALGALEWWIIDGQHRHQALMHHGLGEWQVNVMVHRDVRDDTGAAALMLKLKERAALNPYDRFIQELLAGDSLAVAANQIVESHGLHVARNRGDGAIRCISSVKKLYKKDDGISLDMTLECLLSAWGRTDGAVEGRIVEGVGAIFATYNGGVDKKALVRDLARYAGGPDGIIASARALRGVRQTSLARCVEEVVIEAYNKRRRSGRLGDATQLKA